MRSYEKTLLVYPPHFQDLDACGWSFCPPNLITVYHLIQILLGSILKFKRRSPTGFYPEWATRGIKWNLKDWSSAHFSQCYSDKTAISISSRRTAWVVEYLHIYRGVSWHTILHYLQHRVPRKKTKLASSNPSVFIVLWLTVPVSPRLRVMLFKLPLTGNMHGYYGA